MKEDSSIINEIRKGPLPKHIAIIMDGNGRWAEKRGLPRTAGHQQGVKALREIIEACGDYGVPVLTVYAFSTENWKRPEKEVQFLLKLFQKTIREEREKLIQKGIKVNFIGRKMGLNKALLREMNRVTLETEQNKDFILNIAFNYGGKAEILDGVAKVCRDCIKGMLSPEELNEKVFSSYLYTSGLPDVELLIRPGGEYRLSNFLLWQCAYAELYFTEVYWPDFNRLDLARAIIDFQKRERRFGGLNKS